MELWIIGLGVKQTVLCAKMYNTTLYFRIKTELELIQSSNLPFHRIK